MEQFYQLTLFLKELNADIDNITYFAPNIYATDEQIIYFFLMHLTQLKLFEMHYQILTQEKGQGKQCFFYEIYDNSVVHSTNQWLVKCGFVSFSVFSVAFQCMISVYSMFRKHFENFQPQ